MTTWKQPLLDLYRWGTSPLRKRRATKARRAGRTPIACFAFHRIADDRANAWTTSTRTFDRALRWFKANFDLISLSESQRRIASGFNDRPSLAITFDDGYASNLDHALPFLIAEKIPCAYFVTLDPIVHRRPFEHDLALGLRLAPNTLEEIRSLAAAGIEIGAHTRRHADLGQALDPGVLRDEVVTSRDELQDAIGAPVDYFAFPFGQHANLSRAAFELARQAGYLGVCSAYGGYNLPGDDPFHLQRYGVGEPLARIKNWATVDPFLRHPAPRFQYDLDPGAMTAALA